MRPALLGLVLPLLALPFAAQAQITRLSQSGVTLTASYSRADEPSAPVASGGNFVITTRVDSARFGNAALLEVMLDDGLLPPGETSIRGWALVAVWADWQSDGASSYRFFARKKIAGQFVTVAVPDSLLRVELLDPYLRQNLLLREGERVAGSVLYKALARVSLGADTFANNTETTEDDPRQTGAGSAQGVIVGTGRYGRPRGSTGPIYLPGATSFTGYGVSDDDADVVVVGLRIGPARAVPASQYAAFIDTENGNNSTGPDSAALAP